MDSHTPPPEHCDRSGHAPDNLASLRESTFCVSTTVGISFPLLLDSFRSRSRGWGKVQELAGELPRSPLGRLVDELGMELIPAYSPQAALEAACRSPVENATEHSGKAEAEPNLTFSLNR